MIILLGGAVSSGKSATAQELSRLAKGLWGDTAVIDLDESPPLLRQEPIDETDHDVDGGMLTRRNAAREANNLLESGWAAVVIAGTFANDRELSSLAEHLLPDTPVFLFTLDCAPDERRRRDRLRADPKPPAWWETHMTDLQPPPHGEVLDTTHFTAKQAAAAILGRVLDEGGRL